MKKEKSKKNQANARKRKGNLLQKSAETFRPVLYCCRRLRAPRCALCIAPCALRLAHRVFTLHGACSRCMVRDVHCAVRRALCVVPCALRVVPCASRVHGAWCALRRTSCVVRYVLRLVPYIVPYIVRCALYLVSCVFALRVACCAPRPRFLFRQDLFLPFRVGSSKSRILGFSSTPFAASRSDRSDVFLLMCPHLLAPLLAFCQSTPFFVVLTFFCQCARVSSFSRSFLLKYPCFHCHGGLSQKASVSPCAPLISRHRVSAPAFSTPLVKAPASPCAPLVFLSGRSAFRRFDFLLPMCPRQLVFSFFFAEVSLFSLPW